MVKSLASQFSQFFIFYFVSTPLKNLGFFLFDLSNRISQGAVDMVNALCQFFARSKTPTFINSLQAPSYLSTNSLRTSPILPPCSPSFESTKSTSTDFSPCPNISQQKLSPTIFLILLLVLSQIFQLLYLGFIFLFLTFSMNYRIFYFDTVVSSQGYFRSWKLLQSGFVNNIWKEFQGYSRVSEKQEVKKFGVLFANSTRQQLRDQQRFDIEAFQYYQRAFFITYSFYEPYRQINSI